MNLQQQLGVLLEDLVKEQGFIGASLVSRDGLSVKSAGRQELSRETFSAMVATLMGAAEIALGDVEGGKARSVVATTERLRMVLIGATRDLLLVACVRADAPLERAVALVEAAATKVSTAVGG